MTIKKYFIYIAIIAALLMAWHYRESIEDSIDQKIKDARTVSPLIDDRMEAGIKQSMGR